MSRGRTASTADYPVGCSVRGVGARAEFGGRLGTLHHVRGHVDGRLVVRHWRKHKQRWEYEVIEPWEVRSWAHTDRRAGLVSMPADGEEGE